ncbi:MAG: M50 family metallopeptidase, partial [Patescibacteria group bacterium]
FGGFVRLYGEDLKESGKDLKKAFWSKSKKARAAVTLAGVFMNFLLAIVVFSLVYSFVGIPTKTDKVIVAGVAENSPAGKAGFKEEDIILSVEGISVSGIDEFISLIAEKKGDVINVEIKREENNLCKKEEVKDIVCNGENMILAVVVREDPPEGEGSLGVLISDTEIVKYPFWKMPFYATMEGFKEAFAWTKLILGGFSQMIGSLISHGQVPKDIAGPVGIFQITGNVARSGILAILQFSAVLSVNFAVLNILPFPALDGGRLMFILYELVAGRKPNPKVEQWTNMIGMAILLGLIGLVTINDIFRIKNSF